MSTTTTTTTLAHVRADETSKDEQREPSQAIQAISQGVPLPGIPSFTSIDRKRRWMLEHMAGAFRVFGRNGYGEGMSGHISLRDPEHPDCFWTNPLGVHFSLIKVSDLILLNHDGQPVGGNLKRPANAAGFQIHGHLHRRYPHVNAACHTHSVNGKAWSTFARPLDMINQDSAMFYGDAQAVYKEFHGVVLDPEEGERLATSLGPNGKIMILRNHGLLTVGQTVDEAAYLFTLAEKSCEIQLKVEAAAASGIPKNLIDDSVSEYTFRMTSEPEALYCEFQPSYELELENTGGRFLE